MDIGTALIITAVGAACFYFLTHSDQVRSPLALRIACISLGTSLLFSALLALPRDPSASLDATSRGAYMRQLFVGISIISLAHVVYPMKWWFAKRVSPSRET